MGTRIDAALGILNGTIGDYLARTHNGLAVPLELFHQGQPLALDGRAFAKAHPSASGRAVLLVHGLMATEAMWAFPDGSDYGQRLAADLGLTPFYLRFNTGRAIADNGEALSQLLDVFHRVYPVPLRELILVGHSLGGLVIRSACHVARLHRLAWLGAVRRAIYLGTPHLGSPYERGGKLLARALRGIDNPYTRLIGELADFRSQGVRDLGNADLRLEDRAPAAPSLRLRDWRHPVPLLPEIQHYLVAGTLARTPWLAALFGDSMVSLASATAREARGGEPLPADHLKILPGVSHVALAHSAKVYALLRGFCEEAT